MEQKQGKILIVDDNEDLLKAAKMFLKRYFSQVDIEKKPEAIPSLMNNEDYDVILLDMNFTKDVSSGSEGYYWLGKILELDHGRQSEREPTGDAIAMRPKGLRRNPLGCGEARFTGEHEDRRSIPLEMPVEQAELNGTPDERGCRVL